MPLLRLGVNIDHVATLRNARGGTHPDPMRAAQTALAAGADGLTIHLREDRRHIRDADTETLIAWGRLPVNLEMAMTREMVDIACRLKPHAVCLVPERRAERTTESGLDVKGHVDLVKATVAGLKPSGARVSLFVDPDPEQLAAAAATGAACVELHTGTYADCAGAARDPELLRLQKAAEQVAGLGLECHAGHGLTFDNVGPVAAIGSLAELNIGHFLVGEAVFSGLEAAIRRMRDLMDAGRAG